MITIQNIIDLDLPQSLTKYLMYNTPYVVSPRRLTINSLIIDVDSLTLLDSLFGDSHSWFNLGLLLDDLDVDRSSFLSLLELHNLNLVSLDDLSKLLQHKSSITKRYFYREESFNYLINSLDLVVKSKFNNSTCYQPLVLKEELSIYRLFLLCCLRDLQYFFNYLLFNFNKPTYQYLIKLLELDTINPRHTKYLLDLSSKFVSIYNIIQSKNTKGDYTEYFDIIENIFKTIGGVDTL